jgi:hypothetical protein
MVLVILGGIREAATRAWKKIRARLARPGLPQSQSKSQLPLACLRRPLPFKEDNAGFVLCYFKIVSSHFLKCNP